MLPQQQPPIPRNTPATATPQRRSTRRFQLPPKQRHTAAAAVASSTNNSHTAHTTTTTPSRVAGRYATPPASPFATHAVVGAAPTPHSTPSNRRGGVAVHTPPVAPALTKAPAAVPEEAPPTTIQATRPPLRLDPRGRRGGGHDDNHQKVLIEARSGGEKVVAMVEDDDAMAPQQQQQQVALDWQKLVDQSSGNAYYYNKITGATSWDPPPLSVPKAKGDAKPPSADASDVLVAALEEPTQSEPCPPNQAQPVVSLLFENPKEEEIITATTKRRNNDARPKDDELAPWEKKIVKESTGDGDAYCYNASTGETSFGDAPQILLPPPVDGAMAVEPPAAAKNDDDALQAVKNPEATLVPDCDKNDNVQLFPGWEKVVDESSGDAYFYNQATGETSWDPPLMPSAKAAPPNDMDDNGDATTTDEVSPEATVTLESKPPEMVPDREVVAASGALFEGGMDESKLPPGWEKIVDESSGDAYYYNEFTGETSWEPPMMPPAEAPPDDMDDNGDATTTDEVSPEATVTLESKPPENVPDREVVAASGAVQEGGMDESRLLPGWEKLIDESSGDAYYYNESTGESSWEPPLMPPDGAAAAAELDAPDLAAPELSENDALQAVNPGSAPVADGDRDDVQLPPGWERVIDESTGESYFYNEAAGETSWDPPSVPPAEAAPAGELHVDGDATADEALSAVPKAEAETTEPSESEPAEEVNPDKQVFAAGYVVHEGGMDGLLPGWEKLVDESTGDAYYYNESTGESSWEPPLMPPDGAATEMEPDSPDLAAPELSENDAFQAVNPGQEAAPVADGDKDDVQLPPGWEKIVDESTGESYFYNEAAGETSWDPPLMPSAEAAPAGELHVGGDATADEALSAVPKAEAKVPEPSESEPAEEVNPDKEVSAAGDVVHEGGMDGSRLLPSWEKLVDESSGDAYYYNDSTGESSWEPPLMPPDGVATEMEPDAPDPAAPELSENDAFQAVNPGEEAAFVPDGDKDDMRLPPGCEKVADESTGESYFYNEATGETSWDPPLMPSAEAPALELDHNGNATTDEVSPAVARSEAAVPEPSEGESAEEGPDKVAAASGAVYEGGMDQSRLRPGWEKIVDESSGDAYYYNESTGESSWEPPLMPLDERLPEAGSADRAPDEVLPVDTADAVASKALESKANGDVNADQEVITGSDASLEETHGGDIKNETGGASNGAVTDGTNGDVPLPPGWKRLVDESSGEAYYYNETTEESSWEAPSISAEPCEQPLVKASTSGDTVAEETITQTDKSGLSAPGAPERVAHLEGPGKVLASTDAPEDANKHDVQLLRGWSMVVDETSGEEYYCNETTGETCWDPPFGPPAHLVAAEEKELVAPSTTHEALSQSESESHGEELRHPEKSETFASTDDKSGKEILPPGWEKLVDESSGEAYYYNESTEESSWDPPSVPPTKADPAVDAPATKENALVAPAAPSEMAGPGQPETEVPAEEASEDIEVRLIPGWEEVTDPDSGETYFYNEETGETTWDEPIIPSEAKESKSVLSPVKDSRGGAEMPTTRAKKDQLDIQADIRNTDLPPLPAGWTKAVDSASGETYFFNDRTGETSWDGPLVSSGTAKSKSGMKQGSPHEQRSSGRPAHAIATFGFRGRLCVVGPSVEKKTSIAVHHTYSLVPRYTVIKTENAKKDAGISGPLAVADNAAVTDFLTKMGSGNQGLLWNLISIAARSRGRLRCDSRIDSAKGPETAIVDLLLQSGDYTAANGSVAVAANSFKQNLSPLPHHEEYDLNAVQAHLLRGEREKAVEVALLGNHFAMALLVASMCGRETYYAAAKHYADTVLLADSPLHTAALLLCGHLQEPEDGSSSSSLWGGNVDVLRREWRSHLAAIISNRTTGWDQIAVSLGDRLRDLGEITAAHFCYMVCGCSVSAPASQNSKMTLLGCSLSEMDLLLMSDVAVESFARTEAYEWAKRRGNRTATIQCLQALKLQYAMLLCDVGLVEEAKGYADCILQRMAEKSNVTTELVHPLFVSILSSDSNTLLSHLMRFRRRLLAQTLEETAYWQAQGATDHDITFMTANTSPEDDPALSEPLSPPRIVGARSKKNRVNKVRRRENGLPIVDKGHGSRQPSTGEHGNGGLLKSKAEHSAPAIAAHPSRKEGKAPHSRIDLAEQPPPVQEVSESSSSQKAKKSSITRSGLTTAKPSTPMTEKSHISNGSASTSKKQDLTVKPLAATPKPAVAPGLKVQTAPMSAPANLQPASSSKSE